MITFKVNGEPFEVPSSYDDLKMGQYLELCKPGNEPNKVMSIITGIEHERLKGAVIIGLEDLIKALRFLNEAPRFYGDLPTKIGSYILPINHKGQFNIQFESLGQFEDLRSDMQHIKTPADVTEACPKFCARYLQKIRDGEYNPEKAEQMVSEVLEMPAKEVIV